MPWCPECGGEYRTGFARCPRCRVLLTDEPPSRRATTAGVGAVWARRVVGELRDDLVGIRAGLAEVFRARSLWGILAVFAWLAVSYSVLRYGGTSYWGRGAQPVPVRSTLEVGLWRGATDLRERWSYPPSLGYALFEGLGDPFRRNLAAIEYPIVSTVGDRWLTGGRPVREDTTRYHVVMFVALVCAAPVTAFLLAFILEWTAKRVRGEGASLMFLLDEASRRFSAVFGWRVAVIGISVSTMALSRLYAGRHAGMVSAEIEPIRRSVEAVLLVPLVLTPFVAVGRGVGLSRAAMGGVKALAARWPTLLAVVVVFRAAYVPVMVVDAVCHSLVMGQLRGPGGFLALLSGFAIEIVRELVWACLGLALSVAFMHVAIRAERRAG